MDSLLEQYNSELKRTRALKRSLPNETAEDKNRHTILTGMITDLEIAAYCLETGAPPGYRKKGVYGKTSMDPQLFARVFSAPDQISPLEQRMDAIYEIGEKHGLKGNDVFAYLKWRKRRLKEEQQQR